MSFSSQTETRPDSSTTHTIPAAVAPDFRQHLYEAQDVAHFVAESLELMAGQRGTRDTRSFPCDFMSGAICCLRYLKAGLVALGDEISTEDD